MKSKIIIFLVLYSLTFANWNVYAWPVNEANILKPIAPIANGVTIVGKAVPGQILVGQYEYHDATGSIEKFSDYKWIRIDPQNNPKEEVVGQGTTTSDIGSVYSVTDADVGKSLRFEVIPNADRGQATVGVTAKSAARIVDKFQEAINFYIALNGDDKNDGSFDKPFKTIERAQKEIRKLIVLEQLGNGVNVFLREGKYILSKSIKFEDRDSGTENAPIVYSAYQNEKVEIVGGAELAYSDFKKVKDANILKRLPKTSKAKVVQVDLGTKGIDKISDFLPNKPNELFFNNETMQISRYPNDSLIQTPSVVVNQSAYDNTGKKPEDAFLVKGAVIAYDDTEIEKWANATMDYFIYGRLIYTWSAEYGKVLSVDTENKTIQLSATNYGIKDGSPYYYTNILEEIDSPGEWYLDRANKMLYFYPPKTIDKEDAGEISLLGDSAISITNASYITFKGLNINLISSDAVFVNGGSNILFENCKLNKIGGMGIVMNGVYRSGVVNSELSQIGLTAIRVTGGDRAKIIPSKNNIENNLIYDFNRFAATFNAAISIDGVGFRVAYNKCHDAPHAGIVYSTVDSVIEYNEVYNVGAKFSDIGAVYTAQDWASRGNTIRYNYIHDVATAMEGGSHGLYLDDQISEEWVYGNVFENISSAAIFCNLGRDNIIENNLIINSGLSMWLDAADANRQASVLNPNYTVMKKFLRVDNTKEPWISYYPAYANYKPEQLVFPEYNMVRNNLIYRTGDIKANDAVKKAGAFSNNPVTMDDVGFVDLANKDYTLKSDADLYSKIKDFKGIPFKDIGIYEDKINSTFKGVVALMIGSPKAISDNKQMFIDNDNLNVMPIIKDDRTLVPVRFIAENMGAKVDWNAETKKIAIEIADKKVELTLGSNKISVNGTESEIDVPADVINSRTFIPLRALVESINKTVSWDPRGLILISDKANTQSNDTDKAIINNIIRVLK